MENDQIILDTKEQDRPASREALRAWVEQHLELKIPSRALCPEHCAPMDYLWHSYACDFAELRPAGQTSGDCVVWANRGGGKTLMAAVATLLEGKFKRHCKTRILGGSLEQSRRMYEYLTDYSRQLDDLIDGKIFKNSCGFKNGAQVSILPQSDRAVRGLHVNKLRCDEIELFDEAVYRAAGFITKSTGDLRASMELLSTMHKPYGLMQKLTARARAAGTPVFRWCMWETIENCTTDRSCSRCALYSDCGGRARQADGYLSVDDCIAQMFRSSRAAFEAEMLCLRPSMEGAVFQDFDPKVHVGPAEYNPNLPLFWGVDFGFTNPFVCLWIQKDAKGSIFVIDEYIRSHRVIAEHLETLKARLPIPLECLEAACCDPAGRGSNGVTGSGEIAYLHHQGVPVRSCPSQINEGIELIRRALRNGAGKSSLRISPRCQGLIAALECYHYPESADGPQSELPLKDGVYDHPIDALRYFFINAVKRHKTKCSRF